MIESQIALKQRENWLTVKDAEDCLQVYFLDHFVCIEQILYPPDLYEIKLAVSLKATLEDVTASSFVCLCREIVIVSLVIRLYFLLQEQCFAAVLRLNLYFVDIDSCFNVALAVKKVMHCWNLRYSLLDSIFGRFGQVEKDCSTLDSHLQCVTSLDNLFLVKFLVWIRMQSIQGSASFHGNAAHIRR